MKLVLPQLRVRYLQGAAFCWHIPIADVPRVADVAGERVALVSHDGREFFIRSTVEKSRLTSDKTEVVHAHIEMRLAEAFKKRPQSTGTIEELEDALECAIGKTDIDTADAAAEFDIRWKELPIGSILLPFVAASEEFLSQHAATLVNGRFAIVSEQSDYLSFTTNVRNDILHYVVRLETRAADPVSWDCLDIAVKRLQPEFERLVLANTTASATTGGGKNV